jgi:hypothetical protein
MSTNQLMILFDHEDRIYRADEQISGKVVVEAATGLNCREISVRYQWRTHGSGDQNRGSEETLSLVEEGMKFLKGERREFPFRFDAPTDPLTYHGHYVNVDWYLKASMYIPGADDLDTEEDFLLVARESPAGNQSFFPLPGAAPSHPKIPWFTILLCILAISFLIIGGVFLLMPQPSVALSVIYFPVIGFFVAFIARKKIFALLFALKIDVKEVQVKPPTIHPGDRASCLVKFQTRGSVYLDKITVQISAEEYASKGSGSASTSLYYTLYKEQYLKSYGEQLAAGRLIAYECPLPIPLYAPPTFLTEDNSIKWSLSLKITCKRWPSWEKTIPITVSVQ